MPEHIFDTDVLSNFAAMSRSDLLARRYRGRAFTTIEVSNELEKGIKDGYAYLREIVGEISHEAKVRCG